MGVKLIKLSTKSRLELDYYDLFWIFGCIFLYMMSQLLHESSKMIIFINKVLNSYNLPMSNGVQLKQGPSQQGPSQPAASCSIGTLLCNVHILHLPV